MRKRIAAIVSILLIILIYNNISLLSILSAERETVFVSRVIDGDTLELRDGRTIRLANINSPEKNSPLSDLATSYLKKYENSTIEIEIAEEDRYGRLVARIYAPEYVNSEIVSLGLASKFMVYDSERRLFSSAEEEAISNQRGIWVHSPYWNCIEMDVDAEDEVVRMDNACGVSMNGFYIKDESRKIYKFLNISSPYLELRTGDGTDTTNVLHWDSTSVWNNDRDSAYIFDSDNLLVSYHSYGY